MGDSAEAALTRKEADAVEREMAQGNKLSPLSIAFYLRGHNQKDLSGNINRFHALLLPNGVLAMRSGIAISLSESHGTVPPIIASMFSNILESIATGPAKGLAIEKMTYITKPLKAA